MLSGLEAVLLHSWQIADEAGIVGNFSNVQTIPFDSAKQTDALAKVTTGTYKSNTGIFSQST